MGRPRRPTCEKIQNRIWFTLRQGSHTCRSLQSGMDCAWAGQPDRSRNANGWKRKRAPYIRDALLKERTLHWRAQLGAEAV